MSKLTVTLLAWLLMFAIPVQGFAATTVLFCTPAHHHEVIAATMKQSSTHEPHGDMQANAHHGHEAANSAASAQQDSTVSITASKSGDGRCSACAACCAGSVIVGTPSVSAATRMGTDLIPPIRESFLSHLSERADPPPRSILA